MNSLKIKKICISAILISIAAISSFVSVPVFSAKAAPLQHMVNVIAAVMLGPAWALAIAFTASLVRNILGLGTLLAFPGSIFGALIAGILYKKFKHISFAIIGELFGTAILGALCAYPIALLVFNKEVAIFTYIVPFFISSTVGALIGFIIVNVLYKLKVVEHLRLELNEDSKN